MLEYVLAKTPALTFDSVIPMHWTHGFFVYAIRFLVRHIPMVELSLPETAWRVSGDNSVVIEEQGVIM